MAEESYAPGANVAPEPPQEDVQEAHEVQAGTADDALSFPYRLVIFDWDGTLVRVRPDVGSEFPTDLLLDYQPLPGREEWCAALRRYAQLGGLPIPLAVGIASNQGGIAYHYHSFAEMRATLTYLAREMFDILPWMIRFCPHHPRGFRSRYKRDCRCRKPHPGMLLDRMHAVDALPSETL